MAMIMSLNDKLKLSLNDKLNELPKSRRERILAEADRLHAEYLTLQELDTRQKTEAPEESPELL